MIAYEEIRKEEIEKDFKEMCMFTGTEEFQALLMELRHIPRNDRKDFVQKVILNHEELRKRGIHVPEGMVIQRSIFADRRPTLFCVSKYLRDGKRKITITYDDAEK